MGNNITELVFILDRSGSMAGLTEDTVGGFNSMLGRQREVPGQCLISTVLFNDHSTVLHDRVPLEKVEPLTAKDYLPRGTTALLDAVGDAVHHIRNVHKYIRPEDVPERTMFVITTDGMENASHHRTREQVKRMIGEQEERGWEFLFLGANIDAAETAEGIGIRRERAVDFVPDGIGVGMVYEAVAKSVMSHRMARPIAADWGESIRRDHAKRGK